MRQIGTVKVDTEKAERRNDVKYLIDNEGVARLLIDADQLRWWAVRDANYDYIHLVNDLENAWQRECLLNDTERTVLTDVFIWYKPIELLVEETGFTEPEIHAYLINGLDKLRDDLNGYVEGLSA